MKWTLITGGARGLGREISRTLAVKRKKLVIHYHRSASEALELQGQLRRLGVDVEILEGDFSTVASTQLFIDQYIKQFSDTDTVVNNVGNYLLGAATAIHPQELNQLFHLNVTASLMVIQSLLPSLKQSHGHIVNMGMVGSNAVAANTYASAYNMTKLALAMLTKSLAKELAPYITVNMVSPGYTERSIDLPSDLSSIPMQRPARLEEVAHTVEFLLEQTYITGQNIEVAGGTKL